MPRIRAVKTLKQCCYRRIALSFDKYWMKGLDQDLNDLPRLLYVLGPFDSLTTEMVQSLMETMVMEKCLKRQHFIVLLQSGVIRLDLCGAGMAANNDAVVKTVANMCPKLMALSLRGLKNISARALADVAGLTKLTLLDLEKTNCSDQVLSIIGNNCLELQQLLLAYTKITNSGIYNLCQEGLPNLGCKKLLKLSINGTRVNSDGALHCLKSLPKLQRLSFDDVCGTIELHNNEITMRGGEERHKYELHNIATPGIKASNVTAQSVIMSCQLCPKVAKARLYYNMSDENILAVKNLKHLTHLSLGNSHGLSFENGVLPVFKEIGYQLLELTLADVNDFDLLAVGYYCRNLRKLSVLLSEENEVNIPMNLSGIPHEGRDVLFQTLKSLEITCPLSETNTCIQKKAFVILLKNAKELTWLIIQYVSWMTSEVFQEILEVNAMRKLQELKLVMCDNIGAQVIQSLVYGENDLTSLELHKCKNIGRQDYERLQKYARRQNMDLEISWS